MQTKTQPDYTLESIRDYLWTTLNNSRLVPGFGHAVLRKPDPRFEALMDYASFRPEITEDPLYQLVEKLSWVAPEVLLKHGKVRHNLPRLVKRLASL